MAVGIGTSKSRAEWQGLMSLGSGSPVGYASPSLSATYTLCKGSGRWAPSSAQAHQTHLDQSLPFRPGDWQLPIPTAFPHPLRTTTTPGPHQILSISSP